MLKELKEESDTPLPTDWGRFFLIFGAGVVAAFHMGKAPPVLPVLRSEMGLSLIMGGWLLSAISLLGACIAPAAGAISDALGHRRMMLSGLTCLALGSLAGSFAPTTTLLLETRFLEGLGYIWIVVSAPGLIFKVIQPGDVRLAFGIWGSFLPAGAATMMTLSPFLVGFFGWRGLWQINALVPFAFAVCLALATRDFEIHRSKRRNPVKNIIKDVWLTLKTPGPVLFALCFGAYGLQFIVVTGFLPTLLIEAHGVTPGRAALLTALVVAMNVPGNLTGGWLLQREVKRWRIVALANLVTGLCCLGIYMPGLSLSSRYLLCLVFSGAGGMFPAAALHGAAVSAPTPKLVATSQGLLLQGAQLGGLTGPPLVGFVVSRSGQWQSASWVLVAAALLVVALSFALRSVERRQSMA